MSDPRAVPSGWVTAKLADICDVTMGQSPESKDINEKGKGFPFFQGKAEFGSQHPYNKRFCEFPLRFADKNDVFMSVRAPVGPTNLVRERSGFGRGLCAIKAVGGNNSRFILYQLRLIEHKIAALGTGSTFTAINRGDVEGLEISVAPSMEQTRIVKKLEELFSDLDAGVAELKAAQKKLAQYRQSLLKAAVEGELTAAWRAQKTVHPELVEGQVSSIHASTSSAQTDETETGAQLLGRILAERRRRWEKKQLAKFKEQGKTPPNGWQDKYPEPVKPDITNLPKLPKGWVWASVDQCALDETAITDGPFGSNLKSEHYQENGPRVIRLQNIGDGVFVDARAHISEEHYAHLIKHSVSTGDLVVAMLGEILPRACFVPDGVEPAIVKADCTRVRVNRNLLLPTVLNACLNSPSTRERVVGLVKGIGRPRINLGHIRAIPVPLCSQAEQQAIESALVEANESIDGQLAAIDLSLKESEAQRKNILKSAFSGQLVPQDPDDEPASLLLERIRAERASRSDNGKRDRKSGTP